MSKQLLIEHIAKWKAALASASETAPASAAGCWVSGYVQGLEFALKLMGADGKETNEPT